MYTFRIFEVNNTVCITKFYYKLLFCFLRFCFTLILNLKKFTEKTSVYQDMATRKLQPTRHHLDVYECSIFKWSIIDLQIAENLHKFGTCLELSNTVQRAPLSWGRATYITRWKGKTISAFIWWYLHSEIMYSNFYLYY